MKVNSLARILLAICPIYSLLHPLDYCKGIGQPRLLRPPTCSWFSMKRFLSHSVTVTFECNCCTSMHNDPCEQDLQGRFWEQAPASAGMIQTIWYSERNRSNSIPPALMHSLKWLRVWVKFIWLNRASTTHSWYRGFHFVSLGVRSRWVARKSRYTPAKGKWRWICVISLDESDEARLNFCEDLISIDVVVA